MRQIQIGEQIQRAQATDISNGVVSQREALEVGQPGKRTQVFNLVAVEVEILEVDRNSNRSDR